MEFKFFDGKFKTFKFFGGEKHGELATTFSSFANNICTITSRTVPMTTQTVFFYPERKSFEFLKKLVKRKKRKSF